VDESQGADTMAQDDPGRARRLVDTFREELSESVQSEIGEGGFEKLTLMIVEMLQADRKDTVNMLEEVVKTLRRDIEMPDLGM
jgi:hypothetical protein